MSTRERPPFITPSIAAADALHHLRNESVIFSLLRQEPRKPLTRRQRLRAWLSVAGDRVALAWAALTWRSWDVSKALGSREEF